MGLRYNWFGKTPKAAMKKVKTLKKQAELKRAASESPHQEVRLYALSRLDDPREILEIASACPNISARIDACGALSDQMVLARIARGDSEESVRFAALSQVTEPGMLCEIAQWGEVAVAMAAMRRILDESALKGIALSDHAYVDVRYQAIKRLTDQQTLLYIARNPKAIHDFEYAIGTMAENSVHELLFDPKTAGETARYLTQRHSAERASELLQGCDEAILEAIVSDATDRFDRVGGTRDSDLLLLRELYRTNEGSRRFIEPISRHHDHEVGSNACGYTHTSSHFDFAEELRP